jgi:hypothetical protein
MQSKLEEKDRQFKLMSEKYDADIALLRMNFALLHELAFHKTL